MAPGTLRVWETRYGFPAARRPGGGRKRYSEGDVEQIRAVLEHRASGLSLAAAISRVRAGAPDPPQSMYAALREARPDLAVRVFPKRLLIALSHAIEDEHAARSTGGVLIATFQRERNYRASERRWRTLAASADLTVVMADFDRIRERAGGPVEVPLQSAPPLEREWSVVLHSPTASACLAAWEVPEPRPRPDSERRFEFVWSCDPGAAQAAVRTIARVLSATAPEVAARIPAASLEATGATAAHQRFSDELTSRAFAYLSGVGAEGNG